MTRQGGEMTTREGTHAHCVVRRCRAVAYGCARCNIPRVRCVAPILNGGQSTRENTDPPRKKKKGVRRVRRSRPTYVPPRDVTGTASALFSLFLQTHLRCNRPRTHSTNTTRLLHRSNYFKKQRWYAYFHRGRCARVCGTHRLNLRRARAGCSRNGAPWCGRCVETGSGTPVQS